MKNLEPNQLIKAIVLNAMLLMLAVIIALNLLITGGKPAAWPARAEPGAADAPWTIIV